MNWMDGVGFFDGAERFWGWLYTTSCSGCQGIPCQCIVKNWHFKEGRDEDKTYRWYQYVCEPRMRLYGPPRELLTHLQKLISDNVRKSGLDIPPADTKWSVEGACEAPKINIFSREKVKQLTSHTSSWNSWRLLVAPRFLEDFPFGCRRTLRAYSEHL